MARSRRTRARAALIIVAECAMIMAIASWFPASPPTTRQASTIPQASPSQLQAATMPNSSDPLGDEWPMYRGMLNHTGFAKTTPVKDLNATWVYNTGVSVLTDPIISNGRLYFGSNRMYCLDAETGSLLWTKNTSSGMYASFAIANGRVYAGNENGNFCCVDAITGASIWNFSMKADGARSAPAVCENRVYVGSNDKNLYCLDASSGALLWNYTTGGYVLSSPAIAAGRVFVESWDNKLYCLNATTGQKIWSYSTIGTAGGNGGPCLANGKVYLGDLISAIYCLDQGSGTKIWNFTLPTSWSDYPFSPAFWNGRLYVLTNAGHLYCLDAANGSSIWSTSIGHRAEFTTPSISNGYVYVGTTCYGNSIYNSYGNLYCLDALAGTILWNFSVSSPIHTTSVIANGHVFFGTGDGQIYCFPMILGPPPSNSGFYVFLIIVACVGVGCAAMAIISHRKKIQFDSTRSKRV